MSDALLRVSDLRAGYGRTAVLAGVDLVVREGEMVALIGANGAGKSTLLKAVVGLVDVYSGSVTYAGASILKHRPEKLVRKGLALVPEGRMLFGSMSVEENLELGAYSVSRAERARLVPERLGDVYGLFPVLKERSTQSAYTLSGGEQQMLAVGRALMSGPRMLLLDEPSLGLAPKVIAEIFDALDRLCARGVTVLLVEQDAKLALKHAGRGYVLRNGAVALEGQSTELLADESVSRIYLGGHAE
jgi:branched-chain amino acid transport system ATP-binding protein